LFAVLLCSGQREAKILILAQSAKIDGLDQQPYLKGLMAKMLKYRASNIGELPLIKGSFDSRRHGRTVTGCEYGALLSIFASNFFSFAEKLVKYM
jgi:hypothetical protein